MTSVEEKPVAEVAPKREPLKPVAMPNNEAYKAKLKAVENDYYRTLDKIVC